MNEDGAPLRYRVKGKVNVMFDDLASKELLMNWIDTALEAETNRNFRQKI